MATTIVFLSDAPEDERFLAGVATQAACSLSRVASVGEIVASIESGADAVYFMDVSSPDLFTQLENQVQERFGLYSDRIQANRMYFISSQDLEKNSFLITSPLFGHFLLRNYGNLEESAKHFGRVVAATLRPRAFDLSAFFGPGVKTQRLVLKKTSQKQDAIEAVRNYIIAAQFKTRMAATVANAVDELLMNSMFDAPVDALGKPLYNTTARDAVRELADQGRVEMEVGFDGKYLGITAIDYFGSLDKGRLLSHVSKIYTEEEYRVRSSYAGAGIGLATVFRSGGGLFFVSERGERTEVTVFFRKFDSFREFKEQFRFVSTQFYF